MYEGKKRAAEADEAHEANLEVQTRLDSRSATWPFNAARRDHKHTLVPSAATLQKQSDDKRTSRRIQPHELHIHLRTLDVQEKQLMITTRTQHVRPHEMHGAK